MFRGSGRIERRGQAWYGEQLTAHVAGGLAQSYWHSVWAELWDLVKKATPTAIQNGHVYKSTFGSPHLDRLVRTELGPQASVSLHYHVPTYRDWWHGYRGGLVEGHPCVARMLVTALTETQLFAGKSRNRKKPDKNAFIRPSLQPNLPNASPNFEISSR